MNDKYTFDNMIDEQNDNQKIDDDYYLSEQDFYPPSDDRTWKSYVEDIEDGDNFADYCEYIFELYEEEGYYD